MTQVEFSEWPTAKSTGASPLRIGVVKLNHPKALNSLTLAMVEAIGPKIMAWENDPEIAAVLFYSDLEKAFCAGGDVKSVVQNLNAGDPEQYAARFFRWEYKMDYTLQTYSKPVLTWGDGIVMGGGMGIFAASTLRVMTERAVLAMPEISIGFFPDVGASFFLNKLPKHIALFLAWTAARVNPVDAVKLGLATDLISAAARPEVFASLREMQWTGKKEEDLANAKNLLTQFQLNQNQLSQIRSELDVAEAELKELFAGEPEPNALAQKFAEHPFKNAWLKLGQETFRAGSPTSAMVSVEQLKRAEKLSVLDVFVMEWNLARQMCARKDFREGVRARLIDKDNKPSWSPSSLGEVKKGWVDEHFAPYTRGGESQEEIRAFFAERKS